MLRSSIPFAPGLISRLHLPLDKALYGFDNNPASSSSASTNASPSHHNHNLIDYVTTELRIGKKPLQKWRETVQKHNNSTTIKNLDENTSLETDKDDEIQSLVQSCQRDLNITLSPCVSLFKTNNGSGIGLRACPKRIKKGQVLPTGFYLMSVPCSSIMTIIKHDEDETRPRQPAVDMFDDFFLGIEKLSVPLFEALLDEQNNKFHKWANFLFKKEYEDAKEDRQAINRKTTTKTENLPFLANLCDNDLATPPQSRLGMSLIIEYERRVQELTRNENEEAEVKHTNNTPPPPNVLPALRGVPEHYIRWAASTVLSRRIAGNMLVPLVDFANHSSKCNAFYSMSANAESASSSPSSSSSNNFSGFENKIDQFILGRKHSMMNGFDLIENLFSGVDDRRLLEPHLHLFSIAPIRRNEEITLSYSDVDPLGKVYTSDENDDDQEEQDEKERANETTRQMLKGKKHPTGGKKKQSFVEKMIMNNDKEDEWSQQAREVKKEEKRILVDCGSDNWRLLYGFVPSCQSEAPQTALTTVSQLIMKNRIEKRRELFPPSDGSAGPTKNMVV